MTVTVALLKALADRAPTQKPTRTPSVKGASFDLEQVLSDSGIDIHKVKHEPDGRTIYEVGCLTSTAHTDGAFFTEFPDGGINYSCHHDSCAGKGWQDVKHLLKLL